MSLRNVRSKKWYGSAMSLDDLITQLNTIRAGLNGRAGRVVAVGVEAPQPYEANLISIKTRSELLDHQVGAHLNKLASDVTDEEIDDSAEDALHELTRDGEIVYLVVGPALDKAAREIFDAS